MLQAFVILLSVSLLLFALLIWTRFVPDTDLTGYLDKILPDTGYPAK